MSKQSSQIARRALRLSALSIAVAGAMIVQTPAHAAIISVKGVVSGSYFTPPVISDNPASAVASSTAASVYQGAKVCLDANGNGVCDAGETSTTSKADGSFLLTATKAMPIVAEIPVGAVNSGHAVTARTVFRLSEDQITASTTSPLLPVSVAVTPLSTEIVRMMEDDGGNFYTERQNLAARLGVTVDQVSSDPNKVTGAAQAALLSESVILSDRNTLAAKMVDRADVSPAALAADPNATGPAITIKEAEQTVMNLEGIPRYDHIFIVMLENKATNSIVNSPYAPNINAYLSNNNQFVNYFATGNPSEPNYTALGAADDWGIVDDNQWNCGATGANAVQDLPTPDKTQPGLANSPFTATCAQTTNHNIVSRPNLFNALSSHGMKWRTYSESMNPGQDFRTDSVADAAVKAPDHVYLPGTLAGNTATVGNSNLMLPMPAGLYKTKHHPGMAYQNVRSAPEFKSSNRTLGGGQWDAYMANSTAYAIPAGYDTDQFGTDLAASDLGTVNFVVPDQCDDMHSITVSGTITGGGSGTASDCGSVSNGNAPPPNDSHDNIIARGDNYVKYLVDKIESSAVWQNPEKRVAIVLMFDEGSATSGFNSCCGWNPGNSSVAKPLKQNADGSYSQDTSVTGYTSGNRGHGNSIFAVITNQAGAPKGIKDSDAYSHFSFVRTLQDMFGLSDPKLDSSYMNRSKYTQKFIAANILNLPEYASSADTHFDAVRPMSHAYVIPAGYTEKQSTDASVIPAGSGNAAGTVAPQVGPDANQINVWSLK